MFSDFLIFWKYLKYLNPPSNYAPEKKIVRKDKDLDQFGSVTGHRIFISHSSSQYFFKPPPLTTPHKDVDTPHFIDIPFLILWLCFFGAFGRSKCRHSAGLDFRVIPPFCMDSPAAFEGVAHPIICKAQVILLCKEPKAKDTGQDNLAWVRRCCHQSRDSHRFPQCRKEEVIWDDGQNIKAKGRSKDPPQELPHCSSVNKQTC